MAASELFEMVCRVPRAPIHPQGPHLITMAKALHALGLTPSYGLGDHGNLSCRVGRGCLISARQTSKATLREEQLALVTDAEREPSGWRVFYEGLALPSTDALMHLAVYAQRPEIGAVIHAHDDAVRSRTQALGLPITQLSARVNSLELIDEVQALCARHDYVILRDHGVIALGSSLDAAQARLMDWYRRARSAV